MDSAESAVVFINFDFFYNFFLYFKAQFSDYICLLMTEPIAFGAIHFSFENIIFSYLWSNSSTQQPIRVTQIAFSFIDLQNINLLNLKT